MPRTVHAAALSVVLSAVLAAPLAVAPAAAQSPAPPGEDRSVGEGFGLIEEGARIILRRMMREMEPLMNDLRALIDDLNAYHAPEMLPNGDIILRRKIPFVPEEPAPGPEPEGEIEL